MGTQLLKPGRVSVEERLHAAWEKGCHPEACLQTTQTSYALKFRLNSSLNSKKGKRILALFSAEFSFILCHYGLFPITRLFRPVELSSGLCNLHWYCRRPCLILVIGYWLLIRGKEEKLIFTGSLVDFQAEQLIWHRGCCCLQARDLKPAR